MHNIDSKRKSQIPLLLIFLCAVLLSLVCVSSATLLAISVGAQNEIEASMLAQSEANYQQNNTQLRYGQLNPGILFEATKDAAGLAITSEPYNLGDAIENLASTAVSQIFPTAKATTLPPPSIATVAPEVIETAVAVLPSTATATRKHTATPVTPTTTTSPTPTTTFVATETATHVATVTQTPQPPAATSTPMPPAPPTHTTVPSNTPIPTATNTVMPTSTNTAVPTFTATATYTPTPIATATATATSTSTATATATATAASFDVFFDDFETDQGWVTNPFASDDATTGMWERNDPEETTYDGLIYQLGTTVSGSFDLVTAAPLGSIPGADVGTNDVDDGTTTIRSPNINLPITGTLTLSFSYYLSHYSNSSSNDFLRITIVGNTTSVVLEELGSGDKDAAVWDSFSTNIDSFAGQTIYILIEARDGGLPSLVEAAIDDVRITSN